MCVRFVFCFPGRAFMGCAVSPITASVCKICLLFSRSCVHGMCSKPNYCKCDLAWIGKDCTTPFLYHIFTACGVVAGIWFLVFIIKKCIERRCLFFIVWGWGFFIFFFSSVVNTCCKKNTEALNLHAKKSTQKRLVRFIFR